MNICVQGLWHLGAVTAACMASLGHRVTGLDFDAVTIDGFARGLPPLFEPGLEDLTKAGLASGRLSFSCRPEDALLGIELLWIAYDTPVDDDDNADSEYVLRQVERSIALLPVGAMVLISSQMPVGSVRRLEEMSSDRFLRKDLSFASCPENLRLGKALETFLRPDRIVAGVRQERDRERLEPLLRSITERIEWMSVESAEMTKHAINSFLATSIVFANEIASICEKVGADAKEVQRGLKTEQRIGPKAYLSPGAAFAGGTLARDIAFLNVIGASKGLVTPLLFAVRPSNDEHKQWIRRKLQCLFTHLSERKVVVWGLTYKPGTDTLRRSLSVELCDWLIDQGVQVWVHDPEVKGLPERWKDRVHRSVDPVSALSGASALVLATEWPQYREIAPAVVADAAPGIVVLDANRFLSGFGSEGRLTLHAVGTPE